MIVSGEAVPFICIAGKEDSFCSIDRCAGSGGKDGCRLLSSYLVYVWKRKYYGISADTRKDEHVSNDVTAIDFYYVYGISSEGERGWYVYDSAGDTLAAQHDKYEI